MSDQREGSHTEGPARDIWTEMREAEALAEEQNAAEEAIVKQQADDDEAGRQARQAHCDALEAGLQSAESRNGKRSAELKTQEGLRKAQRITVTEEENTVTAIDDSEEEEVDANLEELLELQAMGVKVVLPTRKRKIKEATSSREEDQVPKDGNIKKHKTGLGEPAARSKSLSAAEGEQL